MKNFIAQIKNTGIIIICLTLTGVNFAKQSIYKYDGTSPNLKEKWEWADETARKQNITDQFWIGYSILRWMGVNSQIGCFRSDERDQPSLQQLLENQSSAPAVQSPSFMKYPESGQSTEEKVLKAVAILFKVQLGQRSKIEIRDLKMSNISLHFNLGNLPLLWLGQVEQDESVDLLQQLFQENLSEGVKEEITTAVGIHTESESAFTFLKKVIFSDADNDVRENATFWLAQWDNKAALNVLEKIIKSESSTSLCKKAVFGIQLMEIDAALDVLIDLARTEKNRQVRREAIFWLSQKAEKRAGEALEDVVFSDEATDIQKHAVFALSQLPSDEGVPRLIKVAKTHPNRKTRKQAIFWLGQSDDERALNALIEIVKQ